MHRLVRIVIGVFEVVGGILGVAAIAADGWTQRTIAIVPLLFGIVFVAMILAGMALMRGHRLGGALSLLVQLLQLPRVAAAACAYHLAAGAGLWVMFGSGGVGTAHALGSDFAWNTTQAAQPMPFGVNLVAAVLIALLLAVPVPKKHRDQQEKRKRRPLAFA